MLDLGLAKINAAQNEVAFSYYRVRGLHFIFIRNLPFSHAVAKIVHAVGNLIALALMLAGFAVVYDFKEKAATPTHFAM